MADMAKWGPKTWTVSSSQIKALQDLSVTYSQIADNNSGTEDNSMSNNRGMELIPITFKTVLNAHAGVKVRDEIKSWKNLVTATEYLYINGTKFGPLLQLLEVKVTNITLDDRGRFREATLTFSFLEYDEKSTSYLGVSALKVGNGNASRMGKRNKKVKASSSSKTTIKKGSKVKIKGSKYSNGKKIPKKVKKKTYTVSKISKGIATLKGLKNKVRVKDLSLVAAKKKKTSKKKTKKKKSKKKGKKK